MRKFKLMALCVAATLPFAGLAQGNGSSVESVVLRASASSSQQVPPILDVDATGGAALELLLHRDADGALTQVIIDWQANYRSNESDSATIMHIHRGALGVDGPVVINSGLSPADGDEPSDGPGDQPAGAIFRKVVINDPATLAEVEAVLANPMGHYVNIHSMKHPAGLVRGQLRSADEALNAIKALDVRLDMLEEKLDWLIEAFTAEFDLVRPVF